jgi:ankyrin repeat protein
VLGISSESAENVVHQSRPYINQTDALGRAALHWAARHDDSVLVGSILQCGADPNVRDRDGKSPLHIAAAFGFAETAITLIAAGADKESRDCFGNTPLHVAAMRGQLSVIEALLDSGADVDSSNSFGESALQTTALSNEALALLLLYQRGADIDYDQCRWGYTPLAKAVLMNTYDSIEMVLKIGARADLIPSDGKTILHVAAECADVKTLKLLASYDMGSIDTEAKDKKGYTAMQCLRLRGDADVLAESFEMLMKHVIGNGKETELQAFDDTDDDSEFFDVGEIL